MNCHINYIASTVEARKVDAGASMRVAEVSSLVAVSVAAIDEEVVRAAVWRRATAAALTINTDPQMAIIRMQQIHINRTFPPLVVAAAHRAIEIGKADMLYI